MEKPNPLQIQDFLLFITSQNTLLTLEVEHQATEKIFIVNLDSDSIGQITNGLFDNVDKMVQGLKDATSGSYEGLTLAINPQGMLTYSAVLAVGVIHKEFSFSVNLKEKEMEPIEIFTRRLNSTKNEVKKWKDGQEAIVKSLEQNMQDLKAVQVLNEERFDRLENMVKQMEEKLTRKLKIVDILYQNIEWRNALKLNISFNNASVNVAKFDLSDNNKTARFSSGNCPCLEILPKIPSVGKYSFSLKMNAEETGVCFGITNGCKVQNWNDQVHSYRYWAPSGKICGRVQKETNVPGPLGGKDSVVQMIVDMDEGTLAFFVDERRINSCDISKSEKYFAYISLGIMGDSVTLI